MNCIRIPEISKWFFFFFIIKIMTMFLWSPANCLKFMSPSQRISLMYDSTIYGKCFFNSFFFFLTTCKTCLVVSFRINKQKCKQNYHRCKAFSSGFTIKAFVHRRLICSMWWLANRYTCSVKSCKPLAINLLIDLFFRNILQKSLCSLHWSAQELIWFEQFV